METNKDVTKSLGGRPTLPKVFDKEDKLQLDQMLLDSMCLVWSIKKSFGKTSMQYKNMMKVFHLLEEIGK